MPRTIVEEIERLVVVVSFVDGVGEEYPKSPSPKLRLQKFNSESVHARCEAGTGNGAILDHAQLFTVLHWTRDFPLELGLLDDAARLKRPKKQNSTKRIYLSLRHVHGLKALQNRQDSNLSISAADWNFKTTDVVYSAHQVWFPIARQ